MGLTQRPVQKDQERPIIRDGGVIKDIEYLPTGMGIIASTNELKESPPFTPGTFWYYCSDFFINLIAIGIAMSTLAIGFGLWKFIISNTFILRG